MRIVIIAVVIIAEVGVLLRLHINHRVLNQHDVFLEVRIALVPDTEGDAVVGVVTD